MAFMYTVFDFKSMWCVREPSSSLTGQPELIVFVLFYTAKGSCTFRDTNVGVIVLFDEKWTAYHLIDWLSGDCWLVY